MVNSIDYKEEGERMRCSICREKYRVAYRRVPGRPTGGGAFFPPATMWHWLARGVTSDPEREDEVASRISTCALAACFGTSFAILAVLVLAHMLWVTRARGVHLWVLALITLVLCAPCVRLVPQHIVARRQLHSQAEASRAPSGADLDLGVWHIQLDRLRERHAARS